MPSVARRCIALAFGVMAALALASGAAADDEVLTDPIGDVVYPGTDVVAWTVSVTADSKLELGIDLAAEPVADPVFGGVSVIVGLEPRSRPPASNPDVCGTYSDELGGQMPRLTFVGLSPDMYAERGVVPSVDGTHVTIVLGQRWIREANWIGVHLEVFVYNELPDWVPDWPGQASFYGGCQFVQLSQLPPTDTEPTRPAESTADMVNLLLATMAVVGALIGFRLGASRQRMPRSR